MSDRRIPQDIEAERALLGSLLIDPQAIVDVAPLVAEEDFFRGAHKIIYAAMLIVHARRDPTDLVLVSAELEANETSDKIGGVEYLTSLIAATPSSVHAASYARQVSRCATLRRLLQATAVAADAVYDHGNDADKAIEAAHAALFAIAPRGQSEYVSLSHVMSGYADRIDSVSREDAHGEGTPTGFKLLDRLTGGFQRGELIVLAGRPGHGKSAMGVQMALGAAKLGYPTCIATLEMTQMQLAHRLVSGYSGVDGQRLRTGWIREEEWQPIATAIGVLSETPVYLDDTPAQSITDIRQRARRLVSRLRYEGKELGLVVVDYLQLVRATVKRGEGRVQEVGVISGELKAMAMELNVPVLACAQLSRAVENRNGNRPQLSDLRESGSIEQDADVVMFLHREELYDSNTPRKGLADLLVAKHRAGPLADFVVQYDAPTTTFKNLAQKEN